MHDGFDDALRFMALGYGTVIAAKGGGTAG